VLYNIYDVYDVILLDNFNSKIFIQSKLWLLRFHPLLFTRT